MSSKLNDAFESAVTDATLITILESIVGAPPQCILRNHRVRGARRLDYTVVDRRSGVPLMAVEFKRIDPDNSNDLAILQGKLRALSKSIPNLPIYFLTKSAVGGFRAFCLNSDHTITEEPALPTYEELTARRAIEQLGNLTEQVGSSRKFLRIKCYFLASASVALAGTALAGKWCPTWELLAIIGSGAAVLLLPEIERIKAASIELRLQPEIGLRAKKHPNRSA